MRGWPTHFEMLKTVEPLVTHKYHKDRFEATCLKDAPRAFRHVRAPFQSLAARMPFVRDMLAKDPGFFQRLCECYGQVRSPQDLAKRFRLEHHPKISALLTGVNVKSRNKELLNALAEVIYRSDLQSMFADFGDVRKRHERFKDARARRAKAMRACGDAQIAALPLTHENIMRRAAVDHFRHVATDEDAFVLEAAGDEVLPFASSLKATLSQPSCRTRTMAPMAPAMQLRREVDDDDEEEVEEATVRALAFRVVHARPANMKTVRLDSLCVAQIEAKIADAKDDPAQCDASKRADAHSKEVSKLPTRTEQEDDRLKMMNSKKSQPARLTVETQKELEQVLAKFKQDAIAIMLGNHTVLTYLFLHIPPYPDRHGFLDAQRDVYIALRTTSREVCRSLFQKEDLQGFLQHLERLRLRNLGAPRVRPKRPRVRLDTGPSVLVYQTVYLV